MYDRRKAAWDRIVSSASAPRGVYVRVEDDRCFIKVGKVEIEVDAELALERGTDAWEVVREEHPELWTARRPRPAAASP